MSDRIKSAFLFAAGICLLVYGASWRTHRVTVEGGTTVIEVADPLVIQATCIGGIHKGVHGLTGTPETWGDTAGKACPT